MTNASGGQQGNRGGAPTGNENAAGRAPAWFRNAVTDMQTVLNAFPMLGWSHDYSTGTLTRRGYAVTIATEPADTSRPIRLHKAGRRDTFHKTVTDARRTADRELIDTKEVV